MERASSSSGTSSRANFARPNGNSSTSTTVGCTRPSVIRMRRWRSSQMRSTLVVAARAEAVLLHAERRQRDELDAFGGGDAVRQVPAGEQR